MSYNQTETSITLRYKTKDAMQLVNKAREYCNEHYDKIDNLVLRSLNLYLSLYGNILPKTNILGEENEKTN